MSDHCHYLIGQQRMDAAELYDLWLRAGYRATEEWVKFLCEVRRLTCPTTKMDVSDFKAHGQSIERLPSTYALDYRVYLEIHFDGLEKT